MPRANGLLLGGAPNERGSWCLEPDESASGAVLEAAGELFANMREARRPLALRAGPRAAATAPEPSLPAEGAFPADDLSMALAF